MSDKIKAVPSATEGGVKPMSPEEARAALQALFERQREDAKLQATLMAAAGIEPGKSLTDVQKREQEAIFFEAYQYDEQIAPLQEAREQVNVRYGEWLKSINHDPLCGICNGIAKTEKGEVKKHKIVYSKNADMVDRFRVRNSNRAAAKSR